MRMPACIIRPREMRLNFPVDVLQLDHGRGEPG